MIIGTQAADNLFTFAFNKVVDGQAGLGEGAVPHRDALGLGEHR